MPAGRRALRDPARRHGSQDDHGEVADRSRTDTFGQTILEAQAAGVPVVAVAAGGPAELVADGRSGVLCPPSAEALAEALARLAASRAARERLTRGGRAASPAWAQVGAAPSSRSLTLPAWG
jgi:glycosyltransferase involved in cell wall biosynthesis